MILVSVSLLLMLLAAAFAAGPAAVFVMLERSSDSATAPGTTIALEPTATVTDAEINRLFNDLRSQYLDARAESITWWLMAAAISLAFITVFVTALGIVIVAASFVGYQWFQGLRDDARRYTREAEKSANEAKAVADKARSDADVALEFTREASEFLEQIKETRQQAQRELEELRNSTAEDVATSNEPQDLESIELGFVETTPVDRATAEAFRLQQQGDMAAAIEKWQAIANILEGVDDERAARAWFSIGYLHGQANEHESALSAFDTSITLHAASAAAYNNRGAAKAGLGRYEEAIADYDSAIGLNPEYATAYYNRGNAKGELSRHEEAIADYDSTIGLNPEYAEAYNNRGNVKAALGRHEEAIADYDKAIEINPEDAEVYFNRGGELAMLDRIEDAKADFEKALELADQQGDNDLKLLIEQELEDLDATA